MVRRVRWKVHARREVGENLEITSKSYLSLWYQIAKKKKLTGVKKVAYIAGYVAVNSINPFKAAKKVVKCVKAVKWTAVSFLECILLSYA